MKQVADGIKVMAPTLSLSSEPMSAFLSCMDEDTKGHYDKSHCCVTETLSTIEKLATEIIQEIAEYLVIKNKPYEVFGSKEQLSMASEGLLELRSTSRTMCAKVDYVFHQCFHEHRVQYCPDGLLRLLKISSHEKLASRIKLLNFVSTEKPLTFNTEVQRLAMVEHAKSRVEGKNLELCYITTLLIAAFKKLPNLRSIILSSRLNSPEPTGLRDQLHEFHPSRIVVASCFSAQVFVLHFRIRSAGYGFYHGVPVEVLERPISHFRCFRNLRDLSLLLGFSICKSQLLNP